MGGPPVPPKRPAQDYTAIPLLADTFPAGPTSYAHSHRPSLSSSTAPATAHVRRRSIGFDTPDVTIHLGEDDANGGEYFSREKRLSSGYSKISADEGEDAPLTGARGGRGAGSTGYISWRDAASGRRHGARRCAAGLVLCAVGVVCWLGGLATADGTVQRLAGTGAQKMAESEGMCNPYDQYGVLNVNTSVPSENMWQPIAAPEDCQPVDFVSLLRSAQVDGAVVPDLDFVRNRTIVIFGDSVDRDHNEHFCEFVAGRYEMIGNEHELSPPYPEGQDLPPEGYRNYFTGERKWPNYQQSRPFVCHLDKLNFRVLNVFHYGFRGETEFIVGHPHFYPPATVEDRFDHIVVPLVASLSAKYGTSTVPDILSIAPGFWGLLRQSVEDQRLAQAAVDEGRKTEQEALEEYNVWRTMSLETRRWNEKRITEILRHLAKGWRGAKDGRGRRRPLILWRALHFIRETNKIPYNRLIALDRIGRSVVDRLVDEGKAAEEGAKSWRTWTKSVGAGYLGFAQQQDEALEGGLGSRLKVDEWGSLMLVRSALFFSYFSGGLFWQLKMQVAEEERLRLARERD
ncbi:hypothetical protein JCM10213v2_001955 [Rhodosporidiobolus nylandii]